MPILKTEMLSTQKSTMTILFIDFDFFPDLKGRFGWFVNLLLFNEIDKMSLFQKWCITFTLMEEMRFFSYILYDII